MAIDFRKTEFLGVAADLAQCPKNNLPEIVISGRSNVGKSSLINAIAENRRLAKIGSMPGKTQLIIYFRIDNKLLLTDLPGYGYAGVSQEKRKTFAALADRYLTSGRPVALILHLIDIRHEPTGDDRQMLAWIRANGLPCQIVLTKADKLTRSEILKRQVELAAALELNDPEALIAFSATSRQGVDLLRRRLQSCLA